MAFKEIRKCCIIYKTCWPGCLFPLHAVVRVTTELIHFGEQLTATTGGHIIAAAVVTSPAHCCLFLPQDKFYTITWVYRRGGVHTSSWWWWGMVCWVDAMREWQTTSGMAVPSFVVSMTMMVVPMVMLSAIGYVDANINISMTYKQQQQHINTHISQVVHQHVKDHTNLKY